MFKNKNSCQFISEYRRGILISERTCRLQSEESHPDSAQQLSKDSLNLNEAEVQDNAELNEQIKQTLIHTLSSPAKTNLDPPERIVPGKCNIEKRSNKQRKQNVNSKKSNNESSETLLAQKYYISSLENKVNHLENLVSVLQKTLDTNTTCSKDKNQGINAESFGTDINRNSENIKIHMLENRLQILENQNIVMNNMILQSQTQAAIRDRQLLMSQYQQPMYMGAPLPGYSHQGFFQVPYVPNQTFIPPHYQQYPQGYDMFRPAYQLDTGVQVPIVQQNQKATVPVSMGGSIQNLHGVQPIVTPQPGQGMGTAQQGPEISQQPLVGVDKGLSASNSKEARTTNIGRGMGKQRKMQQSRDPSKNNHTIHRVNEERNHVQACPSDDQIVRSQVLHQSGTGELLNGKQGGEPANAVVHNESGHFLYIPSLKVLPDVEDLDVVVNLQTTRL